MKVAIAYNACLGNLPVYYPDLEIINLQNEENKKYDLLIFTGGEDISPSLYKAKDEGFSAINPERDSIERQIWEKYTNGDYGKPRVLGICRGHQFLHIMCGGKLIQDLPVLGKEHPLMHNLTWNFENVFSYLKVVNSLHHQALGGLTYKCINLATEPVTGVCEVFTTHTENILGVQFHPEFFPISSGRKFFEVVDTWAKNKKNKLITERNDKKSISGRKWASSWLNQPNPLQENNHIFNFNDAAVAINNFVEVANNVINQEPEVAPFPPPNEIDDLEFDDDDDLNEGEENVHEGDNEDALL